jgi:hypothetical protein
MQLDCASPKPVKAEGSPEASSSPAANHFGENEAAVVQGTGGFAKSLKKAQGINAGVATHPKLGDDSGKVGHKQAKKDMPRQLKGLEDLLGGLNEQELIRVLMQISPKELLRYAESIGLDRPALLSSLSPLSHTNAFDLIPTTGRWGLNRKKLAHLLTRLTELLGEEAVAEAIAAVARERRLDSTQPQGNDAARSGKSQFIGEIPKNSKKPRVVVLDLRGDQPVLKEGREHPSVMKSPLVGSTERTVEAQDREVSVLFRTQFQDRAHPEADVRTTRSSANFEQRFIPEVVKHTGIILRSGGNGEIRLVLKPENLGSVRIRLALSESSLEGRIVVDNNSVKELVESSLDNLKNALRQEGYQANLEVSVGHRRSWNGDETGQAQLPEWRRDGSEEFEKAVPLFLDMKPDYELINLLA